MKVKFTQRESSALYRLLADTTSDIILKTDRKGFIVHASPAIERLGISLPSMLIGPHIQDIVHPASAAAIEGRHQDAIEGRQAGEWIEFPALTSDRSERWFEIQMRRLVDDRQQVYGALSIMRSIEERRSFEEQLFAAAMTDPLTRLTNRSAFMAMLRHVVEEKGGDGCVALIALDHLKAINMKYGQSAGDEALVAFSEVVRSHLRSQDIISRIGGDSLGVLLPAASPEQADAICARIVGLLSEKRQIAGGGTLALTASAGVARIERSVDDTLQRAEMALFFAKSGGPNRLETDGKLQRKWSWRPGNA
jgi:diguanylate cyclase (GGDEF)-like protein/PAS domain S-box-containing protein